MLLHTHTHTYTVQTVRTVSARCMRAASLNGQFHSLACKAKLFAVRIVAAVCAIALGNLMEYLLRFCLPSARCEIK